MFQEGILSTTMTNHQTKAIMVFFESLKCLKVYFTQISLAELPLCWSSYVLVSLEIPKDKTTSKPLWDLEI